MENEFSAKSNKGSAIPYVLLLPAVKFIRLFFAAFFQAWFYVSNVLAIAILLPFLFFTTIKRGGSRSFFVIARWWGRLVLFFCGFIPRAKWAQRPDKNKQYIICPNHTSMADIMLTLAIFPTPFLFIGKKELTRYPLFGYFYKRTNILVDRSSLTSRKQVFEQAAAKLDEGWSLCIFPEGGANRDETTLTPFKMGAFKLAANKGITIIPTTYYDCGHRLPFKLSSTGPGFLRAKAHSFLEVDPQNPDEAKRLKDQCYQLILQSLKEDQRAS